MVSLRLPPAFIEWFLLLYAGADAAVRAGGLHTRPFHLLNGVRQGCAVRAALFSLATGPLLVRLERALGPGNVLANADDIEMLIRRDELLDVVRNIFEDFRRASGIDVNFAHRRAAWHLLDIGAASGDITRWGPFTRGFSLVGRARAANSLVLSAVVHHLHGYLPTDSTIAKLQTRLVNFVWGPQHTAWLPGGVLARPVSVGGLGLLDIGTQLRLACLKGVQAALRGSLNAYSWLAAPPALRGTATPFQRLTTRTARRMLERPRLAALPITQLLGRWLPHVSIPISISWSSLRRGAYLGHNADVAVRLALHALLHQASARESSIACGSGYLSLAHRYWSCRRIRSVIVEAFTIIQRPPDLQSWIFGHDLVDNALAIMASAKTRIYKYFLALELRVWRRTLSRWEDVLEFLSPEQSSALKEFLDMAIAHVGDFDLGKMLSDFRTESDIERDDTQNTNATRSGFSAKRRPLAQEIKATLKNIAESRTQQATGTMDHCVYVEHCPEFNQLQYVLALNKLGGGTNIIQLNKMNGHVLVGLATKGFAERLIEEGLEIEDTLLKNYPFRKRAERVFVTNLPFFVEDAEVIAALRPYGRVTSIAPLLVNVAGFTMKDGRREIFIPLRATPQASARIYLLRDRKLGLEREPVIEALQSIPGLKNLLLSMSDTQKTALNKLARNLAVRIPGSNTPLYKRLSDVRRQTGPGVALLRHRVLWPEYIDLVHLNVHGQKMAVINCHLSHAPHERLEQVGIISETAVQDNAWVVGDLNIDGGPAGATDSASVKALSNLLEQAALEDVVTFFNLAHLLTRVADFEGRIHSSQLDRIPLPAALVERAKSYSTRFYHHSDHRAVLPQLGSPPAAGKPSGAVVLRSAAVIEHLSSYIEDVELAAEDLDDGELWSGWNRIKAEILAEIRSLHTTRPDLEDDYVTRASRYIRARLEASSTEADYPSLPDLGRALRLRRRVATIVRDEEGEIDPADPAEVDNFIAGTTIPIILEEDDPLHRSDISREEIAAAIRMLPTASFVRGALPSSTRRGSICLVPKARSGPGLTGFRPITLPSTDYRVLAVILLRCLRPHLPKLAFDFQTYAIPGRSPSWNIARVTDEVEITTARRLPLAVVSVDLESAFDSLDRGFLISLLVYLGLPPAFIRWIQLLYAGANAAVRIGDHHTAAFPLLNGVRQGRAVSAALFSLATTPLLRSLQSALGEEENFGEVASIFQGLQCASGIRVNFRKSAGLWCGAWHARVDSLLNISWTDTSLMILGCDIRPRASAAMQEGHLLELARLVRFVWGSHRTAWLPAGLLSRPDSLGGFGLLDLGTQMRLACIKGVSPLPDLLTASQWVGARVGDLIGHGSLHLRVTRAALADKAALSRYTSRFLEENGRDSYRVNATDHPHRPQHDIAPTPGCSTHHPAAGTVAPPRWHPISISWSSLRRCAISGHNAGVAVRLALRDIPHPAHPASARESCIASGSGDLSLAHRYWSCRRIRPVIVEAFTIIQRPPDLQSWIFGHDLDDDALAIMASAKTRIYKPSWAWRCGESKKTPSSSGGGPYQEDQLIERQDVIFTKVGGSKKRPHDPDHAKSGAKKGCLQAPGMPLNSSRPRFTPRLNKVHECQTTRQKKATFQARSAAGQVDQCVYLEFCPDFTQEQYFRALEARLGKGTVYQLTKMERHILAGLSSVQLADKLIEEGLDIEDATLRAFPLRKRAERIVLGNVLFFVEDADLVAALRPYRQITSMVQKMMQLEDFCWADAQREAFITLRDGVKLSQIPARLEVKSKGMVTHVYVTYGIKCSQQGHKRANCPRKTGLQEDKLVLPVNAPAARTQGWTKPPSTSNTMPAAASTPAEQTPPTAAVEPPHFQHPPALPCLRPRRTSLSIRRRLQLLNVLFRRRAPASYR
ncbi:hypothetical protein LAZ67_9002049 [Cordylochernes scorpioides]|uniref:Reverse transcriptase domain-containing protein n=1 Tax=Cordylochernes scorpioides TaxID=51811 RepID=A0ABY6KTH7_9ARAC|nr:hypothetical protein LAZ67_9002049 [Cordylochernes scorpioides]